VEAAAASCDAVANETDVRYMQAQRGLQLCQEALRRAAGHNDKREMARLTNDIKQHKATLSRIEKLRRGARRNAANTRDAKLVVGAAKAVKMSVDAQRTVIKDELGDMSIDALMDESAELDDDMNDFVDAMGGSATFASDDDDEYGVDTDSVQKALAEANASAAFRPAASPPVDVPGASESSAWRDACELPDVPGLPSEYGSGQSVATGSELTRRVAQLRL
jgi:hypothetical protein